jgi:hypothetical protein
LRAEWAELKREFESDEICMDAFVNESFPNPIDLTSLHRFLDSLGVVNVGGRDGLDVQITAVLSFVPL